MALAGGPQGGSRGVSVAEASTPCGTVKGEKQTVARRLRPGASECHPLHSKPAKFRPHTPSDSTPGCGRCPNGNTSIFRFRCDRNAAGASSYCTTCNGTAGSSYGSALLRPIVGGSGGGGASGTVGIATGGGGGGGGGAILIASSGTITINGNPAIRANGGTGYDGGWATPAGGSGSGGAIRLIAPTIAGSGTLSAQPGSATAYGGGTAVTAASA